MHYTRYSRWWRFDAYQVRGGYICAAPGAKLTQYDPRARYAPAADKDRPYEALFELFERLNVDWKRPFVTTARGGQILVPIAEEMYGRLEVWCARYGLLGLGLQKMTAVALAPRWQPTATRSTPRERYLVPTQTICARSGGRWMVQRSQCSETAPEGTIEGDLVPRKLWHASWPQPGALVDPVFAPVIGGLGDLSRALRPEPLRKCWSDYFPDVPVGQEDSYAYPVPSRPEEFWRAYGEPVHEFLGAVMTLKRTFEALALRPDPRAEVPDNVVKERGDRLLTDFLSGISPVLQRDEDSRLHATAQSPSLLASFASMILEDIAHSGFVSRCKRTACGRSFVSGASRRYCTERCRRAHQQALFRDTQTQQYMSALRDVLPRSQLLPVARSLRRNLGSLLQSTEPNQNGELSDLLRRHGVDVKGVSSPLKKTEFLEARTPASTVSRSRMTVASIATDAT